MRVLLVCHNYPPLHRAGTEVHTHDLAKRLMQRGHEVRVLTTEKEISKPHLSVRDREYEGVPVREIVNNLFYDTFRETWDLPGVEGTFTDLLAEFRPDVVHFQHLLYLSVSCAELAARRGLPVVMTLHDYWLQCPRYGQLVHADGSICHTIDRRRCGTCLSWFKYKQTSVERAVGTGLATLRATSGLDLGPLARDTAYRLLGERVPRPPLDEPDEHDEHAAAEAAEAGESPAVHEAPPAAPREPVTLANVDLSGLTDREILMGREAIMRDYELRTRLGAVVSRFLCPSRFLLGRFRDWGVPEEQLAYLPHGIDLPPEETPRVPRGERLRVAFIGSLIPAKGPHVLLEAWGLLPRELAARGELKLFGPVLHNPRYVDDLREIAERVGGELCGPLDRAEVWQQLARTDLLVVPSLWFENAPLIILEARAARTPLLVSDLGGMAELVTPGEHGFAFQMGDRHALREQLRRFLAHPEELDALYARDQELPTQEGNVEAVEKLYRELLDAAAPRPAD